MSASADEEDYESEPEPEPGPGPELGPEQVRGGRRSLQREGRGGGRAGQRRAGRGDGNNVGSGAAPGQRRPPRDRAGRGRGASAGPARGARPRPPRAPRAPRVRHLPGPRTRRERVLLPLGGCPVRGRIVIFFPIKIPQIAERAAGLGGESDAEPGYLVFV